MIFGGIQKVSFIDYPGKISTVLFSRGCNFRCFYCHNPELVYPELFDKEITFNEAFDFVISRKGKTDAVVFSGGEPTIHKNLSCALEKIKNEGFLVKLDTNGSNPEIIRKILSKNLVDYIAMDIKTSLINYNLITQTEVDIMAIKDSIEVILNSDIKFEFRTTWDQKRINLDNIKEIKSYLKNDTNYKLQEMKIIN